MASTRSVVIRAIGGLPVLFVVVIIAWSWYAFVFHVCLVKPTLQVLLPLVLFHIELALFVVSFNRVVTTSPGSPSSPQPASHMSQPSHPSRQQQQQQQQQHRRLRVQGHDHSSHGQEEADADDSDGGDDIGDEMPPLMPISSAIKMGASVSASATCEMPRNDSGAGTLVDMDQTHASTATGDALHSQTPFYEQHADLHSTDLHAAVLQPGLAGMPGSVVASSAGSASTSVSVAVDGLQSYPVQSAGVPFLHLLQPSAESHHAHAYRPVPPSSLEHAHLFPTLSAGAGSASSLPSYAAEPPPYRCMEVKRNGQPRYCHKCRLFKPDRCHHCSVCERCTLKMDHHCPWLNNCVGHGNYKYFLLFVWHGTVYCGTIFIVSLASMWSFPLLDLNMDFVTDLHAFLVLFMAGIFGLCLAVFTGIHVYMLLTNMTTIENIEGARLLRLDDGSLLNVPASVNIYSVGIVRNVQQVLGKDARLWLLPVPSSTGDGYTFPLALAAIDRLR
ncbi:DHHC palmitoyltransferase-domain-containing protein [Entophlyctis helioformis]|nr:DHHC palmitoyltransferase-domain-containing protein [Entophlyctis helioformis]